MSRWVCHPRAGPSFNKCTGCKRMQTGFYVVQLRCQDIPARCCTEHFILGTKPSVCNSTCCVTAGTEYHASLMPSKAIIIVLARHVNQVHIRHDIHLELRAATCHLWVGQVKFWTLDVSGLHNHAATYQYPDILTHTTLGKSSRMTEKSQVLLSWRRKCPTVPVNKYCCCNPDRPDWINNQVVETANRWNWKLQVL